MTDLLRDFSQEVGPYYAQVGYGLSLGRTEHAERVGPPLPHMTLPESRKLLRGYEWLMVIPREIARQLGGADGIAAAGGTAPDTPGSGPVSGRRSRAPWWG